MKSTFQSEHESARDKHGIYSPPRTSHSDSSVVLRQSLPTEIAIISRSVDQLMRFIAKFRKADGSEIDIETAVREALANAIVHGNKMDTHKRIHVACRCTTEGEVSIIVQDEGSGFESGIVPDPTDPRNHLLTHGRGIYLIRAAMDEVRFEQGGSVISMWKKAIERPATNVKSH